MTNKEVRVWLASNGDLDAGKTLYQRYVGTLPPLFSLSGEMGAQRCFLQQAFMRLLSNESLSKAIAEEQQEDTERTNRGNRKVTLLNPSTEQSRGANGGEDTQSGGGRRIPRLQDPRLDSAPPAVKDARRRLRQIIPEASRVHLELVVAAREDSPKKFDQLKRRRANLVGMLSRLMDERGALWDVIDDYLGPEEEGM